MELVSGIPAFKLPFPSSHVILNALLLLKPDSGSGGRGWGTPDCAVVVVLFSNAPVPLDVATTPSTWPASKMFESDASCWFEIVGDFERDANGSFCGASCL